MRCTLLLALAVMFGGVTLTSPLFAQEKKAADKKEADKKAADKKKGDKAPPAKKDATKPEDLAVLPGFKVELLYTADPATEGSWICMAKDNKGRLIISGQPGQGIFRVTLADGNVAKFEKLNLPVSGAMGALYAHNSLYLNAQGDKGYGLYRCRDTKGTDQYDDVQLLKSFAGSGEHGPHGLDIGPDGKIYVMNGNHTDLPEGLSPHSQYKNYQEDLVLPRQWDGNGHAAGKLAPGGYVVRTDAEGKEWELVLGGFRNAYDIAFNGDGELFTFDSDMEWDWGMPWYRPVRVNHCVSGAEFGWRSGTGVWPSFYEDSLGAIDIGIGCPTGVGNGIGAKFPAKYQKALYILDWTYGRLIAVHLQPQGSGYTGTFENFVAPAGLGNNGSKRPLTLTDVVIGNDGAMYFTVGGRNTQAALYRVTYTGSESTAPANVVNTEGFDARALRKKLEKYHGKPTPNAVNDVWSYLNSDDRNLRYAARVAVEEQPVAEWKAKALAERQPTAALVGLLALARAGKATDQADLHKAIGAFPLNKLTREQQLIKLRTLGVSFIRHGNPSKEVRAQILSEIDPLFPNSDLELNRELAQIYFFLQAPQSVEKGLKLLTEAKTQEEQMFYLFHLRTLPVGNWTPEQRKIYLTQYTSARPKLGASDRVQKWFTDAGRPFADGNSYNNFLKNFFKETVSNLTEAERKEYGSLIESIDKTIVPSYDVPARPVVKQWKMEELEPLLSQADKGRNMEKGRTAYFAGQCVKCHRFGVEGGAIGPDLTTIAARFNRKQILESIVEPSKVISDQYQNIVVQTASGQVVTGRLMDENTEKIVLQPNPLDAARVEIKKSEIESRQPSKVSPMPEHLINVLQQDEIFDLIAYLESAGSKRHKAFAKQ